ncbi:TonB-dependent receptor [Polynucleobacter kasalickyi]|uniref:Outer membrane receptor proteins, mostly Fe transport n=1 Tax=Polynucleobacter kasalickyi TaxID=1938817 RepID=A0A1W2BAU5_9BURK|nr:TonB-dependent receptor [Polynucleobacter kasalickyi]SMC70039.1 Outer membrane receptor proteins, mostly Fe transport [Polynucleobacter kasalickyi]
MSVFNLRLFLFIFLISLNNQFALAHPEVDSELTEMVVTGHHSNAIGSLDAASGGIIYQEAIEDKILLRPAEVLEMVPGFVAAQHSGDGKANQYFLRGFNLDHGTDFATYLDGMPINMPTHAHGQGYTDLNFLIPELVESLEYRKGPYYAENGDFSSAGSARISLKNSLIDNFSELTLGSNNYQRLISAYSNQLKNGANLLLAGEFMTNDGPWLYGEGLRKFNGLIRYSQQIDNDRFSITAMSYTNSWNATDQIPKSLIDNGLINRYGSMDPSDGGHTNRSSLSGNWRRSLSDGYFDASLYLIRYQLQLYSNFTYFLNNPINGDQFKQDDDRNVFGGQIKRVWLGEAMGFNTSNELGVQFRQDRIHVGLSNTQNRNTLNTIRDDQVLQSNVSLYGENVIKWLPWFRTNLGGRWDQYYFDVTSDISQNSGTNHVGLFSPKLSFIFGPFAKTEFFLNWGQGFHTNDARGTVMSVDPSNLTNKVEPVPGIVKTTGYELGIRTELIPKLKSTLSLWTLAVDSELIFLGNAGITEASRASHRQGIEWTNRYEPSDWLSLQADISLSKARYAHDDAAGNFIPGSVEKVGMFSVTLREGLWSGGMQWRYVGSMPLTEDGSIYSSPSSLINGRIKYQINRQTDLKLDVFNLLNRQMDDIAYYYQYKVSPSALPSDGLVIHPSEPRTFRVSLSYKF